MFTTDEVAEVNGGAIALLPLSRIILYIEVLLIALRKSFRIPAMYTRLLLLMAILILPILASRELEGFDKLQRIFSDGE